MLWYRTEVGWRSGCPWGCPEGHGGREILLVSRVLSSSCHCPLQWEESDPGRECILLHGWYIVFWPVVRNPKGATWMKGEWEVWRRVIGIGFSKWTKCEKTSILQAVHQRLLTVRRVLNSQKNGSTFIYKGGVAVSHFLVYNLTCNPGTPVWFSERVRWAPWRRLIASDSLSHVEGSDLSSSEKILFFFPTYNMSTTITSWGGAEFTWPCDPLQKWRL